MPKYTIHATITQHLEVTIDADSLNDARKIYESDDLITDDYECVNQEFTLVNIVENKGE